MKKKEDYCVLDASRERIVQKKNSKNFNICGINNKHIGGAVAVWPKEY